MERVLNARYELQDRIGEGGMAVTYRARDRLLDRVVAVKVMREQFSSDPEFVERFRREAQSAARVAHPHVAGVYDTGTEGACHYIVMEYVEGEDLKARLRRGGPVPLALALDIATQTAEALQAAHAKSVVHRDIKPANILVTPQGQVKVTDFGIARALSSARETDTGTIVGSVHYFSPEQAKGEAVGPQADLYSLGVVMYEMITGRTPFAGENPVAVAHKQIYEAPPSLRRVRPDVPTEVEAVVARCLEKDLSRRYASAAELIGYLKGLRARLGDGRLSRSGGRLTRSGLQHARRRPRWLAPLMGIALAAAVIAGGVVIWRLAVPPGTTPAPALVGMDPDSAKVVLQNAGLEYAEAGEEFSPTVEAGMIARQSPAADSRVRAGETIEVWISRGNQFIQVPALNGMPRERAERMLAEAGLKLGKTTEQSDPKVPAGYVIDTEPPALTMMERETSVDLVVSTGREAPPPPPPTNKREETISFTVPTGPAERVAVTIEVDDEKGQAVVYEGTHRPGTEIPPQTVTLTGTATVRILTDGVVQWSKTFSQ